MRDITYRGFTIQLRPHQNSGVLVSIRGGTFGDQLYSTSFYNEEFEVPAARRAPRSSAASVAAAVDYCRKWIDERKNLELAIQQVRPPTDPKE